MKPAAVVTALAALAHEYRLQIYRLLVERGPEGLAAGAIGERVGLQPSTLTFHLQSLQRARLITQLRSSRQLIYSADFSVMNGLVGFLTDKCCTAADAACGAECRPQSAARSSRRSRAA